jgi:hypothetical protein
VSDVSARNVFDSFQSVAAAPDGSDNDIVVCDTSQSFAAVTDDITDDDIVIIE